MNQLFELIERNCDVCGKPLLIGSSWRYRHYDGKTHRFFCTWEHLQEFRNARGLISNNEHIKALNDLEDRREKAAQENRKIAEEAKKRYGEKLVSQSS